MACVLEKLYEGSVGWTQESASEVKKAFCNLYEEKNNYIQAGEGHTGKILWKTKGKNSKLQKNKKNRNKVTDGTETQQTDKEEDTDLNI